MTYNYDPVTSSYSGLNGPTSSAVQTPSVTSEDGLFSQKGAASEVDSLLVNNNSAIADIEGKLANATDEEAKQRLVEEKQKLQAKQVTIQNEMNALKSQFEASQSRLAQLKGDLTQLQAKKDKYESALKEDSEVLKSKQQAVTDTETEISKTNSDLSSEIEKMEASAKQIEAESDQELQQQRQAISQASEVAAARVRAGQIKQEDIPAFIASQVGGITTTGSTSRVGELAAQNDKIQAYCKRLGSLITKKINIENYTNALSVKIASSGDLIESMNAEISTKQTSFNSEKAVYTEKLNAVTAKNTEYEANEVKINVIDTRMEAIDVRYAQYNAASAEQAPQTASASGQNASNNAQASQSTQNTSSTEVDATANDYSGYDNMFDQINSDFTSALSKIANKSEVESYKNKIDDAESLIITLRHKLSDDAQKIIEERLAATRRQ